MNARIIEIVGPPGIGKTAIYGSLCKTWRPVFSWIHQDALLSPKPHFSEVGKWLNYSFRALLGKKNAKSIPAEFGMRFINQHQELADFCWNYLTSTYAKETDKRFRSAYLLFTDFCRYQAILERHSHRPCIINEGLLQKSFFVDNETQPLSAILNNYFSLLPLPFAVINVNTCDKNIIIERLQNRNKVIPSHRGKDSEALLLDIAKWQQLLNSMVGIMQQKGVRVLEVDGQRPIKENVSFIRKELGAN